MLDRLQALHSQILALIGELEVVTSASKPDEARLTQIRYQLTRASRSRTVLLEGAYAQLARQAAAADREMIEGLRADGKHQLIGSAQHIGTWSMRRINGHWSEYCATSRIMRASMRKRVEAERALYPLIARAGLTLAA